MTAYHVEIRDAQDRTIVMTNLEAGKVSDIQCVRSGDTLGILLHGETVAIGHPTIEQAQARDYTAWRWELNGDAQPVKRKIA